MIPSIQRTLAHILLALAPAPALLAQGAPRDEIPFEALTESFLERYCDEGATAEACELGTIIDEHCARAALGVFDLCIPAAGLAEKETAKDCISIASGLLDQQRIWIDWLTDGTGDAAKALEDVDTVQKWVDKWSASQLAKVGDEKNLLVHLGASDEVRAANERLAAFAHDEDAMGLVPYDGMSVQVLLAPTRREFMEFVAYVGAHDPSLQESYWIDGVDQWTNIWSDFTVILAMEYAPWGGFDPEFRSGLSMKKFESTGLIEHVVQHSTQALFRYCLIFRDQGHIEVAMTLDLVIEICGQINTIDAEGALSTSGATTLPYERFIPGGNPNGGTLPPMSAAPFNMVVENQWRTGHGKDYFTKPLRNGQKAGVKRAFKEDKEAKKEGDKTAHFALMGSGGGGKHAVSAPFFGEHANETQYPPAEYLTDYREFYRAYKCAFFHWLRTQGGGDASESKLKFRELLRGIAELDPDEPIDDLISTVYGVPFSGESQETDSLEWRFLAWLAEQ